LTQRSWQLFQPIGTRLLDFVIIITELEGNVIDSDVQFVKGGFMKLFPL